MQVQNHSCTSTSYIHGTHATMINIDLIPYSLGCGQALLRKDMIAHQKDDCPQRLQACEKCGEMVKLNGLEVRNNYAKSNHSD